ncbi:MAG: HAMP domain-containing sensor histidine kinase, partial [Cyanobacteria bacterium P01_D01_bin.73]
IEDLMERDEFEFLAEDSRNLIGSMKMGADRIKGIIGSLRNFSRLDEANYKTVDIHEGIDSTLLILQHRLKSNFGRGTIRVDKSYQELPPADCFPGLLNQVFMNVLSNAIDAIEERVEGLEPEESDGFCDIAIATRQVESAEGEAQIEISIGDRGQGIKPESLPHIFNPFFTTKPVGQGTGLGMSISYQIITQQHNGSLTCDSQWGEGTTFRIRIPIQQEA